MSRFGVVLSSGGGRGIFAHTGFMTALDKLDVRISALSGCSAGAIVGGVLASGTSVSDWANATRNARSDRYWTPRSVVQLLYSFGFRQGRGIGGLSETAAAIRFLTENLAVRNFEECVYPFSSVAMNLGTGANTTFDEGPLAPAMMASAAIPGFYEPVEIDGQYYTDGAIIDLAPAEAICCRYGMEVLLIHHTAQHDYSTKELEQAFEEPWTIVKVLQRLIFRRRPWYATGDPRSICACPCGCGAVIVVLEPRLPELTWPIVAAAADILSAAHSNTLTQLAPVLETLRTRPRSLLSA